MKCFLPKRSIGPACAEAARLERQRRIMEIRRRYWDILAQVHHIRLDNALWEAARAGGMVKAESGKLKAEMGERR